MSIPFQNQLKWQIQKAAEEKLVGGIGDDKPDSKFNDADLQDGTKHEMEHTKDKAAAEEIAKDHLTEDPDYYRKLQKIE
jgi:hypothetical protein